MKDSIYYRQAELVLQVLPDVLPEKVFALKGGTAINFFVRDLPRLSIDIDLTYLPIKDRGQSLTEIHESLERIAGRIERKHPSARIFTRKSNESSLLVGLSVQGNGAMVKIEPNTIMRGTVYPCEMRALVSGAVNLFELSIESRTLSLADLYGGKICAALDRQHPRDLYDILLLIDSEGITDEIRKAFIVYLICHPRPIFEVLNPSLADVRGIFEKEFRGMVREPVKCEVLEETRGRLLTTILEGLTADERSFIISIKEGKPRWDLIGLPGIDKLPALRWKLININKMTPKKHSHALHRLKEFLEN